MLPNTMFDDLQEIDSFLDKYVYAIGKLELSFFTFKPLGNLGYRFDRSVRQDYFDGFRSRCACCRFSNERNLIFTTLTLAIP